MKVLIPLLFCMIPAFFILYKKNRGFGYYLLAVAFPLIGLIDTCCLKRFDSKQEMCARNGLK